MLEKFSVGIDIIEVKRFASITFSSHPTFYKKMFLPSEIKYCLKYKNPAPHFAGKFAVKEAAKKIIQGHITMLDIETFHLKSISNNYEISYLWEIPDQKFFIDSQDFTILNLYLTNTTISNTVKINWYTNNFLSITGSLYTYICNGDGTKCISTNICSRIRSSRITCNWSHYRY